MIPRPVVVIVVLVLLVILSSDVGAQFVVPGHTANPVIDGAIIALIEKRLTLLERLYPAASTMCT